MADPTKLGLLAIAACMTATIATASFSQSAPAPGADAFYGDPNVPNLSGLWLGTITGIPGETFGPNRGPADDRSPTYWAPWPLPYTPGYQKIYDERVAAARRGVQLGDLSAKCFPFGLPRMLISKVYPDEIVQTPGQVTFLMFGTFPIVVWTDGRVHPGDLAPSFNGHSIGHWVGDTLFVDTVGILKDTSLDSFRNPHSGKLHIRWTVQRVGKDTLHVHVTLYDDEAFTEPVTTTNIWHRKSGIEWAVLDDQSCFENNGTAPPKLLEPGFTRF